MSHGFKLLHTRPTSHIRGPIQVQATLLPTQLPAGKGVEDSSGALSLATYMGYEDSVIGFWLWPTPVPAVAAILGINSFSLFLSFLPAISSQRSLWFQINHFFKYNPSKNKQTLFGCLDYDVLFHKYNKHRSQPLWRFKNHHKNGTGMVGMWLSRLSHRLTCSHLISKC